MKPIRNERKIRRIRMSGQSLRCALFLVAMSLATTADVHACVCFLSGERPTDAELSRDLRKELDAALAVFVGEPIARNSLTIRFRVESVWKGDLGTELTMSTGTKPTADGLLQMSSCDFHFEFGQSYLIFAHGRTTDTMQAYACTFTSRAREGRPLELLDRVAPRRQPSPHIAASQLIAIIGSVRQPGVIKWTPGLTVAEALELVGGAVPSVHAPFEDSTLKSKIVRSYRGATDVEYRVSPTTTLLPDDELFVAGDMLGRIR